MNTMEIGYFLRGIKLYLEDTQTTQKDFAKGITSKVNLSNILRGNSGTSEKMRQALAKKAGMSVDELIHLGKHGSKSDNKSLDIHQFAPAALTDEDILTMSGVNLLGKVSELEQQNVAANMIYINQINFIIKVITQQRDDLRKRLADARAVTSALDGLVMEIGKDLKVIQSNRSGFEELGAFPGSTVLVIPEHVRQVFTTGQKIDTTFEGHKGRMYPIFDNDDNVKSIVLTVFAEGYL